MHPTPERSHGRSGVRLPRGLALAAALALVAGCEAMGGGATVQLDSSEVSLGRGTEIHDVRIGGQQASDTLAPATVRAAPGDAVRFVAGDRRTHAPAFLAESLSAEVRAWLEETGQLRGPPLVDSGTAWVVVLRDAPAGRYPFVCRSHGAQGVLIVRGAADD